MKQIILIPDSFKGTLSAVEFCRLGAEVIRKHLPDCRVLTIPVADGGEGTVDCFVHALQAQRVRVEVTGPWGESVTADYAVHGDTAFVEMAQAAGLPIVSFECKCGPKDVITDGLDGILVREGDVDGLAQGLLKLIKDEELRRRMGAEAYKNSERFSEERVMAQWVELFNEVCDK